MLFTAALKPVIIPLTTDTASSENFSTGIAAKIFVSVTPIQIPIRSSDGDSLSPLNTAPNKTPSPSINGVGLSDIITFDAIWIKPCKKPAIASGLICDVISLNKPPLNDPDSKSLTPKSASCILVPSSLPTLEKSASCIHLTIRSIRFRAKSSPLIPSKLNKSLSQSLPVSCMLFCRFSQSPNPAKDLRISRTTPR